jgi:hypothetical protein
VERNLYFPGKFMTERDFVLDTDYLLDRHRLHNRLLHGWGIVCGLEVRRHPRPDCADTWVVIGAGMAVDCHGRELVLTEDLPVRLPLGAGAEEPRDRPFLLAARYWETRVEPVRVLFSEESCDPARTHPNRVRDGARIDAIDVTPGCWPTNPAHHRGHHDGGHEGHDHEGHDHDGNDHEGGEHDGGDHDGGEHGEHGEHGHGEHGHHGHGHGDRCHDGDERGHGHHEHGPDCGCGQHGQHGRGGCLDPHCPCGEYVPLARVVPEPDGGYHLDLDGRRPLPTPPGLLTHITATNWPHGGTVTLDHLRHRMNGRLEISFDRRLRREHGQGAGVNHNTFTVQYAQAQADLEFLPYANEPELSEDRCRAVFSIDEQYLIRGRRAIAECTVYVTLRCDFIPDHRGIAVDGNHLRGQLPTGNGQQGGVFESWFRVVFEREAER